MQVKTKLLPAIAVASTPDDVCGLAQANEQFIGLPSYRVGAVRRRRFPGSSAAGSTTCR